MSVERLRTGLILRVALARVASDLLGGLGRVGHALGNTAEDLSSAAFYLELDAARRYEGLTGINLGASVCEDDRYDDEESETVSWVEPDEEP